MLVEVDTAPGVLVETVGRDDLRIGVAGKPTDRGASAHASFRALTRGSRFLLSCVPSDPLRSRCAVRRDRGGHLVVDVQPFAEAVVVLDHAGSATYADNVEVLIGEALHRRWCLSRTGTTMSICRITAT